MVLQDKKKNAQNVATLVEGALCVALSVVLSNARLFSLSQGGSITIEMAPIFFFAYRHGFKWGVLVGALSGLLQLMFGGYIIHSVQAILDYSVAFGSLGVLGLFQKRFVLGLFCAGTLRLLCHVLSGVIFFSSYVPEGQNAWVYSIVYNAAFMVPSLILSGVVTWFLCKRIPIRR